MRMKSCVIAAMAALALPLAGCANAPSEPVLGSALVGGAAGALIGGAATGRASGAAAGAAIGAATGAVVGAASTARRCYDDPYYGRVCERRAY